MYRKFVVAGGRAGCEYGDMTPNCERVRQNPGLCYIPENRYLCCDTCSNIRVTDNAGKLLRSWTQDTGKFDSHGSLYLCCDTLSNIIVIQDIGKLLQF